ncbi:hypothetical protein LRD18_11920 [Halorhodospira halochloris]|uniref:hypothetical protein n=1 Tax=Halorhodospira halochloris TaxID=1052 RepID=UPI001EE81465|nr:hypothetical protein [Halorhodospira halochloris]MCG5531551.1 hypothetical protein [Halorhodospira halochloris]
MSRDKFEDFNNPFLGLDVGIQGWGALTFGEGTIGDNADDRELIMAAYVVRGELPDPDEDPDELGEDDWGELVEGDDRSLDDFMHQGEERVDYWLGELDNGLSRDELLGQMLYEASYGNDGRNTDESNIQFRQAMSEELKARLDAGEIDEDNLLEVAMAARKAAGDSVAANYSFTVAEADDEADLPVWFSKHQRHRREHGRRA